MSTYKMNRPGLGNAPSYQVSGHPYITGSKLAPYRWRGTGAGAGPAGIGPPQDKVKITFPTVTKSFTVINTSEIVVTGTWVAGGHGDLTGSIAVCFADPRAEGTSKANNAISGNHFLTLNQGESYTFDVKCKDLWIMNQEDIVSSSFQLIAELTHIPTQEMYLMSGSGITD